MIDPTVSLVVGVLSSASVAIAVAWLSYRYARRIERERWRRELYARMVGFNEDLRDTAHEISANVAPDVELHAQAQRGSYQALQEIRLVAPQLEKQAVALHSATTMLMDAMAKGKIDQWKALDDAYLVASKGFLQAARQDLK